MRRSQGPVSGPERGPGAHSVGGVGSFVSTQGRSDGKALSVELDDLSEPIDPAELKEFQDGDWIQVEADPVFKERLRLELWQLVESLYGSEREEEGDPSDS